MSIFTPMVEKSSFVCQPLTSASERRALRDGFAKLFREAIGGGEGFDLSGGVKRFTGSRSK